MDLNRFDDLARVLSGSGTRRRVLGLVAALPAVGTLLELLTAEETEAKDRRRRRKGRHKTRKDPGGRKGKGCRPKSKAAVCAGVCGPVKNRQTCGKTVDCGACITCVEGCSDCTTCNPRTNACDPNPAVVGNPCGEAATCTQGTSTPRGTCLADGTCDPGTSRDCAPYKCAGDACAQSCASDDDCVGTASCDGGACVDDLSLGESCANDRQCASGHCAQGVCCTTACNRPCEACNLRGTVGVCIAEDDGAACDGAKGICAGGQCEPCGGGGERCCPGNTCANGGCCEERVCVATGDPCGAAEICLSVTYTPRGTCTAGTCQPGTSVSCAPYRCGRDRCADSCQDDTDCTGDAFCNAEGRCARDGVAGDACTSREQCTSGFCAQGVCCDRDCLGACEACDLAGNRGTCTLFARGEACRGADGVCLGGDPAACVECLGDADCGPCERCGNGNTCVPDATRDGSDCGNGNVCLTGACKPCGTEGHLCCSTAPACGTGLECDASGAAPVCVSCGGVGERCCLDIVNGRVTCDAGLGCATDLTCGACGEPDESCCVVVDPGSTPPFAYTCNEGATCDFEAGTCAACGGDGQPCCDDIFAFPPKFQYCLEDNVCAAGTCQRCGVEGGTCCIDEESQTFSCDGALGCALVAGAPVCTVCGGNGDICCVEVVNETLTLTCNEGLGCNGQTCGPCGGDGERCCLDFATFTPFCDAGLTCEDTFCAS